VGTAGLTAPFATGGLADGAEGAVGRVTGPRAIVGSGGLEV
jgi:hypothetical protein